MEQTKTNENEFTKTAQEAADWIKERDDFQVIGHFDADGLTSIGIIGQTLFRLGKQFQSKAIKQLYSDELDGLEKQNIIFLDLGSGQINTIREKLKDKNILIIDHHTPAEKTKLEENQPTNKESESKSESEILEFNPHMFGIDGGSEISGSGMSFFVARQFGFNDLSALAIVGAAGDMQDYSNAR
ncbi:MAG: DHH family phosphoesterase, partial [Candidatus Diapherotrites archaeon]|nr:DHH family phosphoesterase [Candidatus Diapherotrites archaeon]